MNWEYKQLNVPAGDGMDEALNALGEDGWELVAWYPVTVQQRITIGGGQGQMSLVVCMFKRPKRGPSSETGTRNEWH